MMELRFNPQTVGRLHYGFARQNQVLCLDAQSELWRLAFSPRTPSHALIEAQRVAPCPIDWVFCEDAVVLEKTINQAYSNQETSAAAVADEVAGDLDLDQLMQDIPAVEDLLETEDDAPIIR
ncbi:MAG: type II secretion system protein GspE, partial [Betaproteobacteria bacterium]